MKPINSYTHTVYVIHGEWHAEMRRDSEGRWYAKDEADARIAELEAEREALRVECDGWARERDEAVAERDAARAVLVSGHMGRVLWFVINHAGKGLRGALHDSVEWLEKQIAVVNKARSKE